MLLPVTPGAYQPGGWATKQVPNELGAPQVDASLCTLCLYCWIYCPDMAIGIGPEAVAVNLTLCKGCGICAAECPHGAITMQPPAKPGQGGG